MKRPFKNILLLVVPTWQRADRPDFLQYEPCLYQRKKQTRAGKISDEKYLEALQANKSKRPRKHWKTLSL